MTKFREEARRALAGLSMVLAALLVVVFTVRRHSRWSRAADPRARGLEDSWITDLRKGTRGALLIGVPMLLAVLLIAVLIIRETPNERLPPFPADEGDFVSVSVGAGETCALKTDEEFVCWNSLGRETWRGKGFVFVSAGWAHACTLRPARFRGSIGYSILCWGDNGQGRATPPDGHFVSVSAGGNFTCGVTNSDSIACWGAGVHGQTEAPSGNFTSVSAGGHHACGVRTDGAVACWGNDGSGRATPPGGAFVSVSAGAVHTCGLRTDGLVSCWGSNEHGQSMPPTGTFLSVSAGSEHTCGVTTDHSIACWGADTYAGDAPREGHFLSVSAGVDHTCALADTGDLACWGKGQ